jgi:hypothetical protein
MIRQSPRISESRMRQYFETLPDFLKAPVFLGILGILGSGVLSFVPAITATSDILTALLSSLILFLLGAGGGIVWYTTKPTDAQYDFWVQNQPEMQEAYAMQRAGVRPEDLYDEAPFKIRGYFAPNTLRADEDDYTRLAKEIGDDLIRFKKGRDKMWRSSINTVTYLFPAKGRLGSYQGLVSALDQEYHLDHMQEYYYQHITNIDLLDVRVVIRVRRIWWFGVKKVPYRSQFFTLRNASGESISIILGLVPATKAEKLDATTPSLPIDKEFETTLIRLRRFIREHQA